MVWWFLGTMLWILLVHPSPGLIFVSLIVWFHVLGYQQDAAIRRQQEHAERVQAKRDAELCEYQRRRASEQWRAKLAEARERRREFNQSFDVVAYRQQLAAAVESDSGRTRALYEAHRRKMEARHP